MNLQDYFNSKPIATQGRKSEKVADVNRDFMTRFQEGELTDSTGSRGDGTTTVHNMNTANFSLSERRENYK